MSRHGVVVLIPRHAKLIWHTNAGLSRWFVRRVEGGLRASVGQTRLSLAVAW